jgi:NAD(P)-dependent dehydrogenase (short-subunit alcohol dehydrogenase family)
VINKKFTLGVAAGLGAAWAAGRMARTRHAISFDGRVVVITGGSRGLGLVMARMLVDEGAKVVLLARDMAELQRAKEELEDRGCGDVMALRCDVRRRADVRAAIDAVLDRWRAVDILINNAGVIQVGPLDHMTEEDFENAMATHFWGPLHMILEIAPVMRHRRFGRIVNISSIGGKIAVPHLAPYCASKFALAGLSDSMRAEIAKDGISVTTVCPGMMRTGSPFNAWFKGRHRDEFAWFAISDSLPLASIDARRAALQIVDATRHGDADLVISWPAKLAVIANAVMPESVALAMDLANRVLLPPPTGASGDKARSGWQSLSDRAPSKLTALTERAARENNELPH